MPLLPDDLAQITRTTIEHYEQSAEEFWLATRDHDVSQNITALLQAIQGQPPFEILDVGCGPGRDLQAFVDLGHQPTGLEGTPSFAAMAREYSACPVLEQSFLDMDLPAERFDGVFANASLFHVPRQELTRVLVQFYAALKPGGVFFSSNPRGEGQEGWQGDRYGVFHSLESWSTHMEAAGFRKLSHFYRPTGLPQAQQNWLASLWRK